MKNTSKRILVSVLTLILAAVAIGTTTFAWFTLGNVGTVSGIEGTVVGGEGLQIQLTTRHSDGEIIKQTDFLNHVIFDNNFLDNNFKFTGAEYATLDALTKMYKLGSKPNGHLHRGVDANINKDFIELEFTFRSLQENTNVYITQIDTEATGKKTVKSGVSFLGMKGLGMISDGDDFEDDQMINKNDKYTVLGNNALRLGLVSFDSVTEEEDGMKSYYNGHNESNDSGKKHT